MGQSLKLIGLASLNIFVALALSAAYLMQFSGPRLQAMTEEDVNVFFHDVASVTTGKRLGFDRRAVTTYFMERVAEDGVFKSAVRSSIPGVTPRDIVMDKKAFIRDLLKDMNEKGVHDSKLQVEKIKVSDNGRTATATTINTESASIQLAPAAGRESSIMPVVAVSRCQQTLSLGDSHVILLKSASCTTDITHVDSL